MSRTLLNICDTVFYSLPFSIAHLDSWYIQNLSIFRTQDTEKYWWSLKYSFHENMCNLGIFTTIVSPRNTQKPVKNVWRSVFYSTLSNTGIFRTQGIFRTLSNIYDRKFYSEPCVTRPYLETWHIQNPSHIQNTAKHLSRNILFKTLSNPDIFRALVYPKLWYILKSKHIQNPAKYLRWSILLRTLYNFRIFRRLIYSTLLHIQNRCLSATP